MNNEIVLVTWGGIGDLLVCTPTIRAIKKACPERRLIVYCSSKGHFDLLRYNPHIDSVRRLHPTHFWRYPFHAFLYFFNRKAFRFYNLDFQYIPLSFIYNKSVKEIVPDIFADLNLRLTDTRVQLFFSPREEAAAIKALAPFSQPVLLHIHSRASKNHHWPLHNWEQLVKELPGVNFIQIGHADEPRVQGTTDWRGKHTVREALALLKHARSFTGIDSVFAHATNAFDLPGVVLFGDSTPVQWGHSNNINVYKGTRCSPCFYYVWNNTCPYGHECMEHITVEEVKTALLRQLQKKYAPGLLPLVPEPAKATVPVSKYKSSKAIQYDL